MDENKICPFSMAGEPTECYEDECVGYTNGECVLVRYSLSLYYIAKNIKEMNEGA